MKSAHMYIHMYVHRYRPSAVTYCTYVSTYCTSTHMHTYMNNRNKHTLGDLSHTAYSEESTNRKIFIHAKAHNKGHPLHTVHTVCTFVCMYTYMLPTHTSM